MGVRPSARASVVVGREDELELLRAAARAARSGETACVVLVGEGGVGKTRLLGELATFARHTGVAVLSGRAPIVTPAPFSVFTEALRSWLRGHDVASIPPFDRGLGLVVPEWPSAVDAIQLDGPQLHLLALEGIVRFVARVADASGGAVVLLDDMSMRPIWNEIPGAMRCAVSSRLRWVVMVGAGSPG